GAVPDGAASVGAAPTAAGPGAPAAVPAGAATDDAALGAASVRAVLGARTDAAGHAQAPHRSAGGRTGASHRRSSSSSNLSRVTEQPAISRLVMYGPTSDRATGTPALSRICATSWYIRYSSRSGVPPIPLTNASTPAPPVRSRSRRIGSTSIPAISR